MNQLSGIVPSLELSSQHVLQGARYRSRRANRPNDCFAAHQYTIKVDSPSAQRCLDMLRVALQESLEQLSKIRRLGRTCGSAPPSPAIIWHMGIDVTYASLVTCHASPRIRKQIDVQPYWTSEIPAGSNFGTTLYSSRIYFTD